MSSATDRTVPPLIVSDTDDPRVVAAAATEDYTLHVTPLSWRMGRLSLASVWWGLASAMFWLILGALVALTVGTVDAIIGMVLAAVVYGAINAVFARYAARTGLTSNLFSRALFGTHGSIIAPILLPATAIYFACFEVSVIAQYTRPSRSGTRPNRSPRPQVSPAAPSRSTGVRVTPRQAEYPE